MSLEFCARSNEETFRELRTGHSGLSGQEAERRLQGYGLNALEAGKRLNALKLVLDQFTDPLIYILIAAAFATAFLQDWVDTGVILLVIIVNAVIGFFQEFKAERAITALKSLAAAKAVAVRDGHVQEINSEELVPGDIVLLSSGSRVPADLRLIEVIRLEADESMLTGESVPARKTAEIVPGPCLSPGDGINLAFMGTLALSGRATGIVTATGRRTQLGQISHEVAGVTSVTTPLQEKLKRLSRQIGLAVLGVSVLVVALGLLAGETLYQMLLTGIAMAVGAVPEGLPIVITITLAIGVKRMAERNAIVRRLPAVETLGSTTVIASDKTGTMTRNEMTVVRIYAGRRYFRVTGAGFSPEGKILPEQCEGSCPALLMCLRAGLLANESGLEREDGTDEYKPVGDPTEVSLIVSAMKGGLEEGKEAIDYEWLDEIPFESDRMYMATLCRDTVGGGTVVFVKGAPDRISGMCDRELDSDSHEVPFDARMATEANDIMGAEGLRMLAMACKRFSDDTLHLEPKMIDGGCVFLGIQGMYDPPRDEVFEAIRQAKISGIRVVMVTGDHRVTAVSVARRLGIIRSDDDAVITGEDMERISDDELYLEVGTVNVFSRVSPLHKLRIVRQLIRRGEVVAVTGDGVNDTPALKAAHIGVAMGKSGTDAAKETAEMVITDDNFASIFAAVKEGRVIFANIRKVVLFLLAGSFGQVALILSSIVLLLPLPLLPAQIIWMNLVTNGLQDLAMAFEPAEKGIELQPPRPRDEPVISRLMIERLVLTGLMMAAATLCVYAWQLGKGASLDHARTMALTTLVLFQLFSVFNFRSETRSVFAMNPLSNPFLFFSIVLFSIVQVVAIYWPPLAAIFRLTPLGLHEWAVIVPVAATVIPVVEADKLIRKIMKRRKAK
jgi:Ca2+-transporting ATPase